MKLNQSKKISYLSMDDPMENDRDKRCEFIITLFCSIFVIFLVYSIYTDLQNNPFWQNYVSRQNHTENYKLFNITDIIKCNTYCFDICKKNRSIINYKLCFMMCDNNCLDELI